MKAFVYYNLTSSKWSIKALEGQYKGLVIAHCDALELVNCELKVSQKGRERVVKTGHKTVHAGIVGDVVKVQGITLKKPVKLKDGIVSLDLFSEKVRYNPFNCESFMLGSTPVKTADYVYMTKGKGVYII